MSTSILNLQPEIIENELVKLVPLKETDFEILFEVASDPLIWEQHPNKNRYERDVFQNFFEGAIESKGAFLIVDKTTNEVAGSTRFYEYETENKSVFIGYTFYGRKFWGTGFNAQVKKMMLDYAFKVVDKVQFHIGAENYRSQKAIEKLGARKVNEIDVAYYNEPSRFNFVYEIEKQHSMKRITVFCGSSFGTEEIYKKQATLLGQTLAKQNIELIYGGANVGLMGSVADGTLNAGGKVIGVLPNFLRSKEIAHEGLTELILVESMHERKTKMNDLCDGVIALPGGFGTLEELFEMLTWAQLGLHKKPIAILNINGFYDSLIELTKTMVEKGLLRSANQEMLLVSDNIEDLLDKMKNYTPPTVGKWIDKKQV